MGLFFKYYSSKASEERAIGVKYYSSKASEERAIGGNKIIL